MYEDLVSGSLGSPGLVDGAFFAQVPSNYWGQFWSYLVDFYKFVIDLMVSLSTFVRATPLVMAVISIFFVGFIVALFFRIYNSC